VCRHDFDIISTVVHIVNRLIGTNFASTYHLHKRIEQIYKEDMDCVVGGIVILRTL